jgi:hypothetical protein
MPQAPMSLREIAEAFVKHEDANVVGVIEEILKLRNRKDGINFCGAAALGIAGHIIDFVEAQNEL